VCGWIALIEVRRFFRNQQQMLLPVGPPRHEDTKEHEAASLVTLRALVSSWLHYPKKSPGIANFTSNLRNPTARTC
jgi:hypothetical protein